MEGGGPLNPALHLWMMEWPKLWNSLIELPEEIFHEWLERAKSSLEWSRLRAQVSQKSCLRTLWRNAPPSGSPQRSEPSKPRPRERDDFVPQVPRRRAPTDQRRLDYGERQASAMRDMPERVSAEEIPERRFVRFANMPEGAREALGAEAVEGFGMPPVVARGIPNRVQRLEATGDGQVPTVAAASFCRLVEVARREGMLMNPR